MISFEEALSIIASAARPLATETVLLNSAAGRVLASPVVAQIDSPRADVSAMDGYAVRSADLASLPRGLAIVGASFPGSAWSGTLETGQCVRIFTGGPLPSGADRIVPQEQVRRNLDLAILDENPGTPTWVRPRGKDFQIGAEVLARGRLVDPRALVAAAGADVAKVEVFVRPRLALIATGDELVEPGEAHAAGLGVPDSVSLGLAALAKAWGAKIVSRERFGDELKGLERAAGKAASDADLILVVGGASVGERDFAKRMFAPLGLELSFSKIAMRPGKPAWLGRTGDKFVLGLPGNPTSALVTARLLLVPLLAQMQGRQIETVLEWEPARLISPIPACDSRETFHRSFFNQGEAILLDFQESHAQKTLADANALVRQRAFSPEIHAGETVQLLRL